jgi:hypothetical protein
VTVTVPRDEVLYVPVTELTELLAELNATLNEAPADTTTDWLVGMASAAEKLKLRLLCLGVTM